MQLRTNEMQALIERRDEVVARLEKTERQQDMKSVDTNVIVNVSDNKSHNALLPGKVN